MKDNFRFSLHPCFFLLPSSIPSPFPSILNMYSKAQTTETKQNKRAKCPSERWHHDVLFIFQRNEKLGELSLLGGGDLFDMSRVDFLSFPIYWQNEQRRNIGFGNKEPITLNKLLFIYSNYY